MNRKKVVGLTRFTYESTSFQGYRVSVTHKGENFTKYFSDKAHGGEDKAYLAAKMAIEKARAYLSSAKLNKRTGKHTKATVTRVNGILGVTELKKLQRDTKISERY